MTGNGEIILSPQMEHAIAEVTAIIRRKYPEAQFEISRGIDEPDQIHVWTAVDLDDPDEVLDLVLDRLLELEVEEGIPLYIIPVRSPERILRDMRDHPRPTRRLHVSVSSWEP
jgi:hypothetical protein